MNEREAERPKVKVTDRRRIRTDDSSAVEDAPAVEEAAVVGDAQEAEDAPPTSVESLEEARRQAQEYRDHLQRLQAEFENYRKRVLKEQTRAVEMAAEPLVRRLLEVLDEFDLALMAAEKKPDFDRFLHGVELVYAKLMDILRSEGVERIEAEGKPFDPESHEALMQAGDPEGDPFVSDILRQGYRMRGRVVRPAGVKVTRR